MAKGNQNVYKGIALTDKQFKTIIYCISIVLDYDYVSDPYTVVEMQKIKDKINKIIERRD